MQHLVVIAGNLRCDHPATHPSQTMPLMKMLFFAVTLLSG
jgi:hypothetical protein